MQKLFKTRKRKLHEDVELTEEERKEQEKKEQIERNMYDYQHTRNIGDPTVFNKENFLDENYQMFLKYVNDFFSKMQGSVMQNFDFHVTPEDLKLLNGKEAYERLLFREDEDGDVYVVTRTQIYDYIVKTRKLPNRERVLKMLLVDGIAWQFHHLAYNNEYIDTFEKYFELFKQHRDKCEDISTEVFRFHPTFFDLLYVNFDVYFNVSSVSDSDDSECFLELTTAGTNLLRVSDKISEKLGEKRPLHYYM